MIVWEREGTVGKYVTYDLFGELVRQMCNFRYPLPENTIIFCLLLTSVIINGVISCPYKQNVQVLCLKMQGKNNQSQSNVGACHIKYENERWGGRERETLSPLGT